MTVAVESLVQYLIEKRIPHRDAGLVARRFSSGANRKNLPSSRTMNKLGAMYLLLSGMPADLHDLQFPNLANELGLLSNKLRVPGDPTQTPSPLDLSIDSLGLSTRFNHALKHGLGVNTLRQLCALTEKEFLRGEDLGDRALHTVRSALKDLGLAFKCSAWDESTPMLDRPIQSLEVTRVLIHKLTIELKIQTIGQLCAMSERDLSKHRGIAANYIKQIKDALAKLGLELAKPM